jgi:hypothetical protein
VLAVSSPRYARGVRRRLESAGARVLVADDLDCARAAARSPLLRAVVIVEPPAGLDVAGLADDLLARGLAAPLIHLTSEPTCDPRVATLPRLFTAQELRERLAGPTPTGERTLTGRPKEPA